MSVGVIGYRCPLQSFSTTGGQDPELARKLARACTWLADASRRRAREACSCLWTCSLKNQRVSGRSLRATANDPLGKEKGAELDAKRWPSMMNENSKLIQKHRALTSLRRMSLQALRTRRHVCMFARFHVEFRLRNWLQDGEVVNRFWNYSLTEKDPKFWVYLARIPPIVFLVIVLSRFLL